MALVTALDDRPAVDAHAVERGELRERAILERDAYDYGYRDGFEAGRRAAEREIAQAWAALARSIRADAERLKGTVPEPEIRSCGGGDYSIWFAPEELETWIGGA